MRRKLNIRSFIRDAMGTNLYKELNNYFVKNPVTQYFIEAVYVDQEDIEALVRQLDFDYELEELSEGLYNVLKGALTVQLEEDNA